MQLTKPRGWWTLERCQEEALKYDTRKAFEVGANSAYQIAKRNGWSSQICKHMATGRQARKWTFEACRTKALKYESRTAFKNEAGSAYHAAWENGWLGQICAHMHKADMTRRWDFENCHAEALKYETRGAFECGSTGAYNAARRKHWLDQVCGHMLEVFKPRGHWTFERCQAEALKYKTRKSLELGTISAYQTARRNGWLDQICEHMIDGSPSDGNCFYLWLVVGAYFNGLPVYKPGVTSTRLKFTRIEQVAKAGGLEYDLVLWLPVTDARAIEARVKTMGVSPRYTGFNGCTEFRAFTDDEVKQIKAMALAEFVL
jgi:hypothetical protein